LVILPGEKTISNRTRKLLQQTLSDWQQWSIDVEQTLTEPPELIRELLGGRTNETFLVASGGFKAVVRVNSPISEALGIDRQREAQILNLLAPSGVSPNIFYITDEVLVSEYIEGQQLTHQSLKNTATMEAVSVALRAIQAVTMPGGVPRNYQQYCRNYLDQLGDDCVSPLVKQEIETIASAVDNSDWQPVICHHDMVPQNIIENARGVTIIDWEYAALGHPDLDFMRLFGADFSAIGGQENILQPLFKVQQAMDKLWLAVQL
jgi:thiamine kinase